MITMKTSLIPAACAALLLAGGCASNGSRGPSIESIESIGQWGSDASMADAAALHGEHKAATTPAAK